tara:strand:- start:1321 stop:1596 length:276 start_codon:yes stop_codon:yes gene_type:complete
MEHECPEQFEVCFTQDDWINFVTDYELEVIDEVGNLPSKAQGDAEAAINFTWELLFLSPWELVYIALPMSVLAFYGLTIYATFKYIQRKFK